MAAVSKLAVRNVFADDTKITITIDNLRKQNVNIENIRTKVKAFNAAQGGTLSNKMVSKNGAAWVMIDKVTLTTTDRTYIF